MWFWKVRNSSSTTLKMHFIFFVTFDNSNCPFELIGTPSTIMGSPLSWSDHCTEKGHHAIHQANARRNTPSTSLSARISDSSTSADLFIDHRYFVAYSDDNIRDDDILDHDRGRSPYYQTTASYPPLTIADEWWIELINGFGGASGSAVARTISVALPIYRSAFRTCATSHFTVFKITFRSIFWRNLDTSSQ